MYLARLACLSIKPVSNRRGTVAMSNFDALSRMRGPARRSLGALAAKVGRTLVTVADAAANLCRRIRAYNDLTRLDHRTLQALGQRPGEIARVLDSLLPRKSAGDG